MSLLTILLGPKSATIVAPVANTSALFSGLPLFPFAITAPNANASRAAPQIVLSVNPAAPTETASRSTPSLSSPALIAVAPAMATAARTGKLVPLDSRYPLDVRLPEASGEVPATSVAVPPRSTTAAVATPTVRTTVAPTAPLVSCSSVVAQVAVIVVTPVRVTTGATVLSVPLVSPLVIPAATARAEQFRLLSPTGQPEPPYSNVTIRQLI